MVRLTFPLIPLIFLLLQVPDTVIRKVPSLQPSRGRRGGELAASGVLINAAVIICDIFAGCSSGFSRGRKKKKDKE